MNQHGPSLPQISTFSAGDTLDDSATRRFREEVLRFYHEHGRHEMVWRHTTDPYQILVSELMLQQTQVERVEKKFPAFVTAFPDFASLAAAPLHDILTAWQGMGYNRRAISLKKIAGRVMDEYDGVLPQEVEILATFPGIGSATASSIAAFAFNAPVVFIETNIRRVFIHVFFCDRETVRDTEILPLVGLTLDREKPRVWYWSLFDLGAALKRSVTNPNRRSAHYTRQAPFDGSDRRVRGQIIKALVAGSGLSCDALTMRTGEEAGRVNRIVAALETEGFLVREGELVYLA
ncbi:MAG: A/G-specific adenine glycosylase [Methanoregula sp.]|nr:A/G-specific adenine glycosylase [Methanoregula sp.]